MSRRDSRRESAANFAKTLMPRSPGRRRSSVIPGSRAADVLPEACDNVEFSEIRKDLKTKDSGKEKVRREL